MIKIEITDLRQERPQDLVKLATFLLDFAGHGVREVPEEVFRQPIQPQDIHTKAAERVQELFREPTVLTVDELPEQGHRGFEIHDEIKGHNFHDLASAPYQHCGSAQAYGDLDTVPVSAMDMPTNFNEISTAALKEAFSNTVNAGIRVLEEPIQVCDDKGMLQANDLFGIPSHNHIVAESAQGFLDKFVKPLDDQLKKEIKGDELTDILKRAVTPKKRKHKSASEVIKKLETENLYHVDVQPVKIDIPPDPVFAPPPPVNGNTVIDKIVMAKATNKLTHEQVTSIVRKHGLVAIKDIFTNDHLIPLIDADLDEALRGK